MDTSDGKVMCGVCRQPLGREDEWITLDGGEIWCATCWTQRFAPKKAPSPDPTPAETPVQEAAPTQAGKAPQQMYFDSPQGSLGAKDAGFAGAADTTAGQGTEWGWFYQVNGQQVGPVPTEALARMVGVDQVDPNM